jgi:hypothetical protein
MTKKSLFLGAAAVAVLSLLVLLTLAGCSNPSSSDTAYVTQSSTDYPYPEDTVIAANRGQLDGLLNTTSAETNGVTHIRYTGGIATQLEIPGGKVVYLDSGAPVVLTANIVVTEGARLVLVDAISTSNGAPEGKILVRGSVEVFGSLTVGDDALDVADYTVENDLIIGRNTVIGKPNVTVLPGAVLTLALSDIIPPKETLINKFTPAQAWAAAGQGHLVIGNTASAPRAPDAGDALVQYNYTVEDLLNGVIPSESRTYTAVSGRITSEELPAVIPAGAYLLTNAVPTKTRDNAPLTVYGSLSTNGTLNDITKIEIKSGGRLTLTEPDSDLLKGLEDLILGPGAALSVNALNDRVSLAALETLFLGDGSFISILGNHISFKGETDPVVMTLGKNVTYRLGMSPAAKVHLEIKENAGLVAESTFTIYPGSTFSVAEGVTFTVDGNSVFDMSNQVLPANQVPAATEPDITIDGIIEVTGTGIFAGPSLARLTADPALVYKLITLGPKGKVRLNFGANFTYGTPATVPVPAATAGFVGVNAGGGADTYEWAAGAVPGDGAQIEINAEGLVIRETDRTLGAVVTVAAPGATILKNQTLTLERGVTLAVGNTTLTLLGVPADTGRGATILGPGRLTMGTAATAPAIVGDGEGWRVIGTHNIVINGGTPALTAFDSVSGTALAATPAPAFTALGLGSTITVPVDGNLTISAYTDIALGGTSSQRQGQIILTGDAGDPGMITFTDATSRITTGNDGGTTPYAQPLATDGDTDISGGPVIGITNLVGDGAEATVATTAVYDGTGAPNVLNAGWLVSLVGGTAGTVEGGGDDDHNGDISAETRTNATP